MTQPLIHKCSYQGDSLYEMTMTWARQIACTDSSAYWIQSVDVRSSLADEQSQRHRPYVCKELVDRSLINRRRDVNLVPNPVWIVRAAIKSITSCCRCRGNQSTHTLLASTPASATAWEGWRWRRGWDGMDGKESRLLNDRARHLAVISRPIHASVVLLSVACWYRLYADVWRCMSHQRHS